ncbi:MAG: arginine--tRNA ligase [Planctomycetes bacterium]|nr:arginine--tRNA ligase [Planctomycetota bacterium]
MQELLTAPLTACISTHLGVAPALVAKLYAPPAKGLPGDIAVPCFQLAKAKNVAPPLLAAQLADVVNSAGIGAHAAAAGPFLNITLDATSVALALLPLLAADPRVALRSRVGAGRVVCVDFSSPNIAKHMAFHHIRSTMIGNALALCYDAAGWKVVRINFLGDWGTAFGRLIAGWKREGLGMADLEAAPNKVTFLNQLYVRISRLEKEDPTVEGEARQWSRRCEEGDAEALALWETIRTVSVAACQEIYRVLGVTFDDWSGESRYRDAAGPIVAELKQKGLLKEDQGAQVVDLSSLGMKKPCLILRSDGGSLYATRDLAACDDRHARYHFARSLYEVDLGQSLHFKEWFAVAKLLGRPYADSLRHVGHGIVLMWNDETSTWEKTATRKGIPMMLMDILAEAIERARAVVADKNPEIVGEERERIAAAVGVGAVVFNDLKNSRTGDVKFKFEEALRFDGETGPYLQFSHARLCSIERKFPATHPHPPAADPGLLTLDSEKSVLLAIARLVPALERVAESDEPSALAQAVLSLATTVASWLTAGNHDEDLRVLCPDPAKASARLALVRAARGVLGEGLRLLGLQAPERM